VIIFVRLMAEVVCLQVRLETRKCCIALSQISVRRAAGRLPPFWSAAIGCSARVTDMHIPVAARELHNNVLNRQPRDQHV